VARSASVNEENQKSGLNYRPFGNVIDPRAVGCGRCPGYLMDPLRGIGSPGRAGKPLTACENLWRSVQNSELTYALGLSSDAQTHCRDSG
jgi:hypothetical protein